MESTGVFVSSILIFHDTDTFDTFPSIVSKYPKNEYRVHFFLIWYRYRIGIVSSIVENRTCVEFPVSELYIIWIQTFKRFHCFVLTYKGIILKIYNY